MADEQDVWFYFDEAPPLEGVTCYLLSLFWTQSETLWWLEGLILVDAVTPQVSTPRFLRIGVFQARGKKSCAVARHSTCMAKGGEPDEVEDKEKEANNERVKEVKAQFSSADRTFAED
ncbi:hypothetical protein MMC17_004381, partial [Xylographa soralifera]|nr:hypothetical protein [Xylographa soralifera]